MTNTNDPNKPSHGTSTITPVAGKKGFNWLPWLLAALGILLLLFTLSQCSRSDEPEAETAATTTTQSNSTQYADGSTTTSAIGPDGQTTTTVTGPLAATAAGAGGAAGAGATAANNISGGALQTFLTSSEAAPRTFTLDQLNFATGSAQLPAGAQQMLAGLAQSLAASPSAAVRIVGYADARGAEPVNQQLGQQRADAVAQALISAGMPAARVTAASGGESNPVDTNATAPGQAENRRTELVVTAK
jgi:outer membrane protein OmpA-like peptidoglycan-associated protein